MVIFKNLYSLSLLIPFVPVCTYLTGTYQFNLFTLAEISSLTTVVWYSGITLTVLSFWAVSQRITVTINQLVAYASFLPLVYLFTTTSNLLVFFMCYEFFLLPSFLVIFFGSPNRRGVLASIYFLMWTQVGSFLVFVSVLLVFLTNNSFQLVTTASIPTLAALFAFVGFGIKIPVWPAHYWLTKTHVEAPTYFSIYLSGFLVKTALYGIWLFTHSNSTVNHSVIVAIAAIGVIDSSLKMWSQVDLKKLVAYGTVQEMNLILIGFILGSSAVIKAASLFILAHTILSTMFFLFADSIYKRFSSRSTSAIRGLLQTSPSLGYQLFICCLLFAGLPFTLKFVVEVYIFTQLLLVNPSLLVITLFVCNWFGIISFMKNWFTALFGSPSMVSVPDLSVRELLVYSALCLPLVILSFLSVYLI
jgi:formate hydrogenlyase subunit 3/multisubunit Na+/H+ antiporter MnhD subunit